MSPRKRREPGWPPDSQEKTELSRSNIPSRSATSQLRELPGETFEDIFGARQLQLGEGQGRGSVPRKKPAHKEGTCRSCGASVYWITTERNRKSLPLNPEPSEDVHRGNFLVVDIRGERLARWINDQKRAELISAGAVVWEAHFASCEARR